MPSPVRPLRVTRGRLLLACVLACFGGAAFGATAAPSSNTAAPPAKSAAPAITDSPPATITTPTAKAGASADVAIPAEALSESARDILARTRPSVLQIKGFFGNNSAQEFHGTGFAVAPGGVLLTNYHVVAQEVMYPEKYRLEYRSPEGKTGKVAVLAIDVRHDLAVVRAEGYEAPPLPLAEGTPARGIRAYSVGFPLDVGLTITQGVSNGKVEDSFEARIHYSGAINGGMSGGPALNANGQVIGVNVSGYRGEQSVAFLVPAEHARPLIERALKAPLNMADAKKEVGAQLQAHAKALLDALPGPFATQSAGGYALPGKLSAFMDCNAAGDPASDQPVQTERFACGAKAGLHVQENLRSGEVEYQHFLLTTDKLDAWRFAHRLGRLSTYVGGSGSREHVGPYACKDRTVKLKGFDADLLVCSRSYRKFEGLYDLTVRVVSLNQPRRGFVSRLYLTGVDFDAGMAFVKRYVEAMQWQQ